MSRPTAITKKITATTADPAEAASHPPPSASLPSTSAREELRHANRWLRSAMVGELVRVLRRKSSPGKSARQRKRKTALAFSAGIMALSPAATSYKAPTDGSELEHVMVDAMKTRVDASDLKVSEAMKIALAEEEGVRLTVYRDVAGYPTVGVGHLVTAADGLKVGDTITYEQALELLEADLAHAEEAVARIVGDLPLYQYEFDALVDLVYNVGEYNAGEKNSPKLNAAIQAGDYEGIAAELAYHHAGGSKANGLVYRSERRQAIFNEAAYDDPRPASISVSGDVQA